MKKIFVQRDVSELIDYLNQEKNAGMWSNKGKYTSEEMQNKRLYEGDIWFCNEKNSFGVIIINIENDLEMQLKVRIRQERKSNISPKDKKEIMLMEEALLIADLLNQGMIEIRNIK